MQVFKCELFLSEFKQNWNMTTNFNELSNNKFHENQFHGSWVILCVQTNRQGEFNGYSSGFWVQLESGFPCGSSFICGIRKFCSILRYTIPVTLLSTKKRTINFSVTHTKYKYSHLNSHKYVPWSHEDCFLFVTENKISI